MTADDPRPAGEACEHQWGERGGGGDYWWQCWLCGAMRDDPPPARPAASGGATDGELRRVLLTHHPIAHTDTGPLKGCRCGQVRLGQDVIAHVVTELRRALDGER